MSSPRVLYVAPCGQSSGYGSAADDYASAMIKAGVDLKIRANPTAVFSDRYKHLDKYLTREIDADVILIHAVPPALTLLADKFEGSGAKLAAFTTWETNVMPQDMATDIFDRFAAVVVPSQFCAEAMRFGGVAKVIPHCFDPDWWFATPPARKKDQPFTFFSILTEWEQKNLKGLLVSYLTEFTDWDHVELVVQTPSWDENATRELVQMVGLPRPPKARILTKRLSPAKLRELHWSADAYVSLSRGEGFGLGAFESMLVGNPVIATDWGGHKEYLHPSFGHGFPVGCFLTPVAVPWVQGVRGKKGVTPAYQLGPLGISGQQLWAEPNLEQAKRHMRFLFDYPTPRDTEPRGRLAERFSYSTVGTQWKELLEAL